MQTESLDYYWILAKKLIMVHGYSALLRDDENIGYIASTLIKADLEYDPKIGILEGYRSMHAKYAILKLIKKIKNTRLKLIKKTKNTRKHQSLNSRCDKKYTYIDSSQNIIDCEEMLDFISRKNIVSDETLEQIKDRYLNNFTWREIADKFSVTKQSVRLNVKHGISKIKKQLCT